MRQSLVVIFLIVYCASEVDAQKISDTWDHEIEVISETEKFDGQEHDAYSTFIYEVTAEVVRKMILDEVKASTKAKVTKRNMIYALEVDIPKIGTDPLGVKAITNSIMASDATKLSIAFFHDSLAINEKDFPESDKAAREVMHDISVRLNRLVVTAQIVEIEEEIADATKDYNALIKDKSSLEKQINNGEEKIAEFDAHLIRQNSKLAKVQHKAEKAMVAGGDASADSKEAKKLAKSNSKVMSAERAVLKTEQSKIKAQKSIDQAAKALPLKEQEIAEFEPTLEKLHEKLEKFNAKHNSIN